MTVFGRWLGELVLADVHHLFDVAGVADRFSGGVGVVVAEDFVEFGVAFESFGGDGAVVPLVDHFHVGPHPDEDEGDAEAGRHAVHGAVPGVAAPDGEGAGFGADRDGVEDGAVFPEVGFVGRGGAPPAVGAGDEDGGSVFAGVVVGQDPAGVDEVGVCGLGRGDAVGVVVDAEIVFLVRGFDDGGGAAEHSALSAVPAGHGEGDGVEDGFGDGVVFVDQLPGLFVGGGQVGGAPVVDFDVVASLVGVEEGVAEAVGEAGRGAEFFGRDDGEAVGVEFDDVAGEVVLDDGVDERVGVGRFAECGDIHAGLLSGAGVVRGEASKIEAGWLR